MSDKKTKGATAAAAQVAAVGGGKRSKGRGSTLMPAAPYGPGCSRSTVRAVSEMASGQTISQAVAFKIVKLGLPVTQQQLQHSQKWRQIGAAADNSGAIRLFIYGIHDGLEEGKFYKIRNFCYRDGRLVLHTRTSTVR